jgi:replicative DNA helicase
MTATSKRKIVRKSTARSTPKVRAHPRGWNAEQALISTMLIDQSYHEVVEAGVTEEWFHSFREEWKFVHRYIGKHKATPSRRIMERKFPEFRLLDAEDIHYLIDEVRQLHTRHALLMLTGEITEAIREKQDPTEVLKVVERRILTVTGQVDGSSGQQSDLVADWMEGYAEVSARVERANDTGMSGITTGFPTLDQITGGIDEGHYWVVGARLGAGKTWMAAQMACAALIAGFDVIYFSLEMPRRQMEMRMHNLLSSKFGEEVFRSIDLMQGRGFDLLRYKKYLRRLPEELSGHLIIDDSSGKRVTPTTIAAQIERHRPRLIIVDYLTLMSPSNDWQAVSDTSAALKTLCSEYDGISIVAAAQINRAGAGKRPPSADEIAGSDGIGRDVDAIVTMASQSQRVKRMHLAKYRHGPDKQMWYAALDLRQGTFSEISGSKAQDLIDEDEEAAEMSREDDE